MARPIPETMEEWKALSRNAKEADDFLKSIPFLSDDELVKLSMANVDTARPQGRAVDFPRAADLAADAVKPVLDAGPEDIEADEVSSAVPPDERRSGDPKVEGLNPPIPPAPVLPTGTRRTTVFEDVAGVGTRVGGLGTGIVTGIGKQIDADIYREQLAQSAAAKAARDAGAETMVVESTRKPAPAFQFRPAAPWTRPTEPATVPVAPRIMPPEREAETDKLLEATGVPAQERAAEELYAKREPQSFATNVRESANDLIVGLYELGARIGSQPGVVPEGDTFSDVMSDQFDVGQGLGEGMVGGITLDVGKILTDPAGYFQARPTEAALFLAPILRGTANLAGASSSAKAAAGWLKDAAGRLVPDAVAEPFARRVAEPAARGAATYRRMISDPSAQAIPAYEEAVRGMTRESGTAKLAAESMTARAAGDGLPIGEAGIASEGLRGPGEVRPTPAGNVQIQTPRAEGVSYTFDRKRGDFIPTGPGPTWVTTQLADTFAQIADSISAAMGGLLTADDISRMLANASSEAGGLARVPEAKAAVLAEMQRRAKAIDLDPKLIKKMGKAADDVLSGDAPVTLALPDGSTLDVPAYLTEWVGNLDPKMRKRVEAGVVVQAQAEIGSAVAQAQTRKALVEAMPWLDRTQPSGAGTFGPGTGTSFAPTNKLKLPTPDEFLTILATEGTPPIGPNPALVLERAQARGLPLPDLDPKRWAPLGAEAAAAYGLPAETYAVRGVAQSLIWRHKIAQAVKDAGWWAGLTSSLKRNLTSRNIASGINNYSANFALQTTRRGEPFLAADLIAATKKINDWKKGKASADDAAFLSALEREGVFGSGPEIELTGTGFRLDKPMEDFYGIGDEIFKVEDAFHSRKKIETAWDALAPGKELGLEVRPGVWREITKGADGRPVANGKVMTDSQWQQVQAAASAVPGEGLFFRYDELGLLPMRVKSAPIAGVSSPFVSWFAGSLDLPGKKGLGARLYFDGPAMRTSDPALAAALLAEHAAAAVKAGMVRSAIRDAVPDEQNPQAVRDALKWSPSDAPMSTVRKLKRTGPDARPEWLSVDPFSSVDFLSSADLWLRAADSVLAPSMDRESVEALYPGDFPADPDVLAAKGEITRERAKEMKELRALLIKKASGAGWTPSDFAKLFAAEGNPMVDAFVRWQNDSEAGKSWGLYEYATRIGPLLVGTTAVRIGEILGSAATRRDTMVNDQGVEVYVPESSEADGTRTWLNSLERTTPDALTEPDGLISYMFRTLTGLGGQPKSVKVADYYFTKVGRQFKDSLGSQLKKRIAFARSIGDEAQANRLTEIATKLDGIVDYEVGRMKADFEAALDRMDN